MIKKLFGNKFVRVGLAAAAAALVIGIMQKQMGGEVSVMDVFRQAVGDNANANLQPIRPNLSPEQLQKSEAFRKAESHYTELAYLLQRDTPAGLAELAKLPPGTETLHGYEKIFQRWVTWPGQGTAAATAAYNLPAGPERTTALTGLLAAWTQREPRAALQWAINLPATDPATIKTALVEVSRQDPKMAAPYIDKIADATARNQAIGAIAGQMARNDPAAALDWLDQTATGVTYENSVKKLMANLSARAPAQAAALLEKVTESAVRQAVINNIAQNWSKTDPQAAQAWLQSLPDGVLASGTIP